MGFTGKSFLHLEKGGKRSRVRSIAKGTSNLHAGRVISFLIKFLDMQFAFSDVLGFSSGFSHMAANHKRLISGSTEGGAVSGPARAKAAFHA